MTCALTASPQPLCRLEGVSKSYASNVSWRFLGAENAPRNDTPRGSRTVPILDGVDLEIVPGEILGLVGRSGAGKTTLARILALMETPDSGCIAFAGRPVNPPRVPAAIRRQVQYVFQNPAASLNPRMSVWRQLLEAPLYHRLRDAREASEKILEISSTLGLEASSLSRYPHEFSGGQLQRLAVARALSVEPRLLVCDEITASLDRCHADELLRLLQKIRSEMGVAIVFVTHDLHSLGKICDRVLKLHHGKLHCNP